MVDTIKRALELLSRAEERIARLDRARHEPIAIVGLGCRFPGHSDSPEQLWDLLAEGRDAIVRAPRERHLGDSIAWGGFLHEPVDAFDGKLFRVSPREARSIDPQHRLLLEVAWEALERAAIAPTGLLGTRTGVFVGISTLDYRDALVHRTQSLDGYAVTGNMFSAAAGRLSYTLGLQGPAVSIDTACSSSLVALHLACQSLRLEECELALCGGVNLILGPTSSGALAQTQALSPDGRCKTFDARANGYVRGEGCGVVVLKRLSDAQRDGDPIAAVIRGSAVNQDGRSQGLTAPNQRAQQVLIEQALRAARVEAHEVGYVEAHGTGTPLGDPIEIGALQAVYSASASGRTDPLRVSSIKTNIGHLEAAAGVAGLFRTVLSLQNETIPRHLNLSTLNPMIDLEGTGLEIPLEARTWRSRSGSSPQRRIAAISSFGMTGTNAHVLVEEAPETVSEASPTRPRELIVVSSHSPDALPRTAGRIADALESGRVGLRDLAHTAATGRAHHEHRIAVVSGEPAKAAAALRAPDEPQAGVELFATDPEREPIVPKIAFLYTGAGAQQVGMGRGLDEAEPVYTAALDRCCEILDPLLGLSTRDLLYREADGRLDQLTYTQPALFAVGYALSELWRSWGVEPDCVLGHSTGELIASCVAGLMSLEDGLRLIVDRAALMQSIEDCGGLMTIRAPATRVIEDLQKYGSRLSLASYNSPDSVVVSGSTEALNEIGARYEARGFEVKPLRVSRPAHSPMTEPILEAMERLMAGISRSVPHTPVASNVSGALETEALVDPAYWARHMRQPVLFHQGVEALLADGCNTFVEIGPHPTLLGMSARAAEVTPELAWVPSLRRGRPEFETLGAAVARLWTHGVEIDWDRFERPHGGRRVVMPTSAFDRQSYWHEVLEGDTEADVARGGEGSRLHGKRVESPGREQQHVFSVSVRRQPYLADHLAYDEIVVPGSYFVANAASAADAYFEGAGVEIRDVLLRQALVLADDDDRVQGSVVVSPQDDQTSVTLGTLAPDDVDDPWRAHCSCTIAPVQGAKAPLADLQRIRNRCTRSLDVDTIYELYGRRGVGLKAGFRWMRELWTGERETLGRLERPDAAKPESGPLHPAQLDSCFQTMMAALLEEGDTAFVPFSIEELRIHAWAPDRLWVHAQWDAQDTTETVRTSARLYDDDGALVAEIVGLSVKAAPRELLLAAKRRVWSDWTYTTQWLPRTRPTAVEDEEQRWLIVGPAEHAPGLLAALERTGQSGVALAPPEGELDDWAPALGAFLDGPAGEAVTGIVHTWAMDLDDIEERGQVLGTAKNVIAAVTSRSEPLRVAWVTRGAQRIAASEHGRPLAAALAGLGRVVASEHPSLDFRVIDLDPSTHEPWDGLAQELQLPGEEEPSIALRGDQRLVERLARVRSETLPMREFAPKSDGSYVITGGLGGLGLCVARWLAERGAGRIVLLGRSAPREAAQQAVAQLRDGGCDVQVVAADVCDRDDLAAALQRLESGPPVRGVFHVAGVLADGLVAEQSWNDFDRALGPKVLGAASLEAVLQDEPVELFVAFASFASLLGSPGQGNYAAANAYLDAFAARRSAQGSPSVSIDWGPWAGGDAGSGGMFDRLDERERQRIVASGLRTMTPDQAIEAMADAIVRDIDRIAITPIDWTRLARRGSAPKLLERLLPKSGRARSSGDASALTTKLAALDGRARRDALGLALKELAARVLGMPSASAVDEHKPLQEFGLDSLMAVELRNGLSKLVGKRLPATLVFDYPTLDKITDYLLENVLVLEKKVARAKVTRSHRTEEPIAIVGMSCRFPGGANDPQSYWEALLAGVDAITEIPKSRFDIDEWFDPDPDALGKTYARWGGFLSDVDQFDADFFGISHREATVTDPQQRFVLELAYEALENAGHAPDRMMGTSTGVFLGIAFSDYAWIVADESSRNPYAGVGTAFSGAAGRVAYVLGLQGPTLSVDTACSSSLVSLHLACQALRAGECEAALAAGVNMILRPRVMLNFARLRSLSPDGRCKTFDASANGYVRAEGAGVLVLKRLSQAEADGDRILALIRGTACNQDGRSNGMTAPNGPAQQDVIARALAMAGVEPADVGYIEAHGTGTELGDPIEVQALAAVLGEGRDEREPVKLGSVKTNIGHAEAASGMAGVMKVVQALRHEVLPASLHFHEPNPHIAWDELPVAVVSEPTPWPRGALPRLAGVSGFGITGTNVHALLSEAPEPVPEVASAEPQRPTNLFVLSARTESALREQGRRMLTYVEHHPDVSLTDMAWTLAVGRSNLPHRAAFVAADRATLMAELGRIAGGDTPAAGSSYHQGPDQGRPRLAFLFSPHGAQTLGMGAMLDATSPVFRQALDRCAEVLDPLLGVPLRQILTEDADRLQEMRFAQPAVAAIQVALVELWKSWGIEPEAVMGHSLGEYVAAHVAGVFDLETALTLVATRGRLMQSLPEAGAMLAISAPLEQIEPELARCSHRVSVAAINGPENITLSGEREALEQLAEHFVARGVKAKMLAVSQASHSPLMDPILDSFEACVAGRELRPASLPIVSNVTGTIESEALADPTYWRRHLRQPVRFDAGLRCLLGQGVDAFIEIGPHPVLLGLLAAALGPNDEPVMLASMRREHADWDVLGRSLAELHVRGGRIDFEGFEAPHGRRKRLDLPTYPFECRRFWYEGEEDSILATVVSETGPAKLHGRRVEGPTRETHFVLDLGVGTVPYLADHTVAGRIVVPGAYFVTAALSAAEALAAHGDGEAVRLRDVVIPFPLVLQDEADVQRAHLLVGEDSRGKRSVELSTAGSEHGTTWRTHLSGTLEARAAMSPERVDVQAIAERCPRVIEPEEMYAHIPDGVHLGPGLRWVTVLRHGEGELLARLERPEGVARVEAPIHPGLFDGCFQALMSGFPGDRKTPRLPFEIGRLDLHAWAGDRVWVHARWTPNERSGSAGDLTLLSEDGDVIAEARGFVAREARTELIESALASGPGVYALKWRPLPALVRSETTSGHWLVVGDLDRCSELPDALAHTGATVTHWAPEFVAALEDPSEALAGLEPPLTGIVDLSPLGAGTDPRTADCRNRTIAGPLRIAQAAVDLGLRLPLGFTLVTAGAQPVVGGVERPVGALTWGLGRVIAKEHPDLGLRLVDLDDGFGAPTMDALVTELVAELGSEVNEPEIGLAAGSRYAPRVVRSDRGASSVPSLDAEHSYVVTGGAGALGRAMVQWLAERGARHVVVLSRSANEDACPPELAELRSQGVHIRFVGQDVADEAAARELVAQLRSEGTPVGGLVHAAGILDEGVVRSQTPTRIDRVLHPKVDGACAWLSALKDESEAWWMSFASMAGVVGSPGQAGYAAANTYLDALAHHEMARGRTMWSLDWGPWAAGLAGAMTATAKARLVGLGLRSMETAEALQALPRALGEQPQPIIVDADWATLRGDEPAPLLAEVAPRATKRSASGLVRRLGTTRGRARREMLVDALRDEVGRVLGRADGSQIEAARPLQDLGMDSLMAVQLRNGLSKSLGVTLPATLIFEHPTIEGLADHLLGRLDLDEAAPSPRVTVGAPRSDEASDAIAIIGMGCRFPGGANSPEALWELLVDGVDTIGPVPKDRWDHDAYYDPDPDQPGKSYVREAAFLTDVDKFDARYFGLSRREAEAMDPQQRLLLEVSAEALERAGIAPGSLNGSATGVFVGLGFADYARLVDARTQRDAYVGMGNATSVAAGRISYTFGFEGPSMVVDTACSSSLVCMHLAGRALLDHECDLALAGGVNLMLEPDSTLYLSRLRALSPGGRCRTFDAQADGYARGEGCGIVVLKRLSDARRDGDDVLAIVRGSATNQDGRSNGLTAPSGVAQQRVIRAALEQARLRPDDVDYVEAHGTGTPLGDPIEVRALAAVFAERPGSNPLRIGSAKTNFGHTEGAAGIAGVMKTVLALRHGVLPRSLHFETPSPHIEWDSIPVEVVARNVSWTRTEAPRRAGVSSFGMSGTNAHVVLEEGDAVSRVAPADDERVYPLLLSAKSSEALRARAGDLADWLERHEPAPMHAVAKTLAVARDHHEHRVAWTTRDVEALPERLRKFAQMGISNAPSGVVDSRRGRARVGFAFSGQGAQTVGMGRQLDEGVPAYREALDRCAAVLDERLPRPLRSLVYDSTSEELSQTRFAQPALFAVQYALFQMWAGWGLAPDALVGHSIGEIVAATVAGVFDLEDALNLVEARGRLMQSVRAEGSMLSVEGELEDVDRALDHAGLTLEVAAINSPYHRVYSGPRHVIAAARKLLEPIVRSVAELRVSHAFHSAAMDEMLEPFAAVVGQMKLRPPQLPIASNLTGRIADDEMARPDYWVEQVRRAVRFGEATRSLAKSGCSVFLELGPHPVLTPLIAANVPEARAVASLHRERGDEEAIAEAWARLYVEGVELEPGALFSSELPRVGLPTYPWQRRRYWHEGSHDAGRAPTVAREPARSARSEEPTREVTPLVQALEARPPRQRRAELLDHLVTLVADAHGSLDAHQVDPTVALTDLGLTSLTGLQLRDAVGGALGLTLPATLIFDHPTLQQVADYLLDQLGLAEEASPGEHRGASQKRKPMASDEPIAIVGIGCRFAGDVQTPDDLWALLEQGIDAVREVPEERFDVEPLYDPEPGKVGRTCSKWGSFVSNVDGFDAPFFGISAREADAMDPQQRLLLEVSWEALEHAGIAPASLDGSSTGVYIGLATHDYAVLSRDALFDDPYAALGSATSVAAGRLAYVLGLRGPTMAVDTSCSSSLVSLHLACQALRNGECETALAGGVNLILTPEPTLFMSQMGALATDGRCKTFDARANGYVRSDGCGMVVLKRLSDAQADGDRILAVVRGSAVNQDGRSNGLTAPNGPAQIDVIRRALGAAGVEPTDIDYVEAHGTGTALGDPIEVGALGTVFEGRAADEPVRVGSIKTNLGHTEGAAGIVGVIKVVLSMQRELLPAHLNFETPTPHVPWEALPLRVVAQAEAWPRNGRPRRAGVSSFGMSGTNAHVVLEDAPVDEPTAISSLVPRQLVMVSARSATALQAQAARLAAWLDRHPRADLATVAACLSEGRNHFSYRASLVGDSCSEIAERLRELSAERGSEPAPAPSASPKVAMLFTGAGAQYPGMGQALECHPVYRQAIDDCDEVLGRLLGMPLRHLLYQGGGDLDDLAFSQPALFAVQYASARLWKALGVTPDVVMGHSTGELVAACVAGVFELDAALELVARRGRLMASMPAGGLLAVRCSAEEALEVVGRELEVCVAAYNGPQSTVLAGAPERLAAAQARLEAAGLDVTRLRVSNPAHSPLTESILEPYAELVAQAKPRAPELDLVANVSGNVESEALASTSYWRAQMRQPVQFERSIATLGELGCTVFVEAGPHPVLLGLAQDCLPVDTTVASIPSNRRDHDPWEVLLQGAGTLWERGVPIDWAGFAGTRELRGRVVLPTYPFERRRHWIDVAKTRTVGPPAGGGVLGRALPMPAHLSKTRVWESELCRAPLDALAPALGPDARMVSGSTLLAMARAIDDSRTSVLIDLRSEPRALADLRDARLQLVEETLDDERTRLQLFASGADDAWHRVASAEVQATAMPDGPSLRHLRDVATELVDRTDDAIVQCWRGEGFVLARTVPGSDVLEQLDLAVRLACTDGDVREIGPRVPALVQGRQLELRSGEVAWVAVRPGETSFDWFAFDDTGEPRFVGLDLRVERLWVERVRESLGLESLAALQAEPVESVDTLGLWALPPDAARAQLLALVESEVRRILGVRQVPLDVPLTHLGIDSLMAAQLAKRASSLLGERVGVADVFRNPTVSGFTDYVLERRRAS